MMTGMAHGSADDTDISLAAQVLDALRARGWYLACAESLTGGLLADAFVSIPGASDVFCGSAVTYRYEEKAAILGVERAILESCGAVDPRVARQMAAGAQRLYSALPGQQVLTLSTTGVAGPTSDGFKPVGTVFIGLQMPGADPVAFEEHFAGDRPAIRAAAVESAVRHAYDAVCATRDERAL